jgi:uncharacterized protein (TIGR00375 family)
LDKYARIKGIDILATADFTHPAWFRELENKLVLQDNGFYQLKNSENETKFILSTEISCIYKKGGKCRRIHLVVICSSLTKVKKVNEYLEKKGYNIKSDGRPILGLDVKELAKIYLEYDDKAIIIPAHIWTPWFSLFGSYSGFDSLKECFEEISDQIPAIETGLSSDPRMNWRISQLNNRMILSNSDAHSLDKLGREANVFNLKELSYKNLYQSIKNNKNLEYTIEFYPEEGKYHYDGHVDCHYSCDPKQSKKNKNLCPKCSKPLTIGVMNRVEVLADQDEKTQEKKRPPFKSLVPLAEILAEVNNTGVNTKAIKKEHDLLINRFTSEFNLLLNTPVEEIKEANNMLGIAINKMRKGDIVIKPGYDGIFGTVKIFSDKEREKLEPKQNKLF